MPLYSKNHRKYISYSTIILCRLYQAILACCMFIDITGYFMLLLCDCYVVFILTLITVLLSKSTELVGY